MGVLFTDPKLAGRILTRSKTTHTVPRHGYRGSCLPPPPKVAPPWKIGATCAVQIEQARTNEFTGNKEIGRHTICHVRVVATWPWTLNDFTDQAAQAEGFDTAAEFFRWWRERREGVEPPASDARPAHEVLVWTAAVEPVELDHFLAPGAVDPLHVPADEHGYLLSPVRAADDMAAVERERAELYSAESDQDKVRRLADYEQRIKERPLTDRLAALREAASSQGTDISRIEARIARAIEAGENKVFRQKAA